MRYMFFDQVNVSSSLAVTGNPPVETGDDHVSVLADHIEFGRMHLAGLFEPRKPLLETAALRGNQEAGERLADDFVAGVAQQVQPGLVDFQDSAVHVERLVPQGRLLVQEPEMLFASAQNLVLLLHLLAAAGNLLRPHPPGHSLRQPGGQAFDQGDELDRESPLATIVQLNQAERLFPGAKGDESDRFVFLPVAAVASSKLAVSLGRACQQLCGRIRPEAPAGREKRQSGIKTPSKNVAAHALQHGVALEIAHDLAAGFAGTERAFCLNEFLREAAGLEIGEIVALANPDAHGVAARPLAQDRGCFAHQRVQVVGRVGQMQELRNHRPLSMQLRAERLDFTSHFGDHRTTFGHDFRSSAPPPGPGTG